MMVVKKHLKNLEMALIKQQQEELERTRRVMLEQQAQINSQHSQHSQHTHHTHNTHSKQSQASIHLPPRLQAQQQQHSLQMQNMQNMQRQIEMQQYYLNQGNNSRPITPHAHSMHSVPIQAPPQQQIPGPIAVPPPAHFQHSPQHSPRFGAIAVNRQASKNSIPMPQQVPLGGVGAVAAAAAPSLTHQGRNYYEMIQTSTPTLSPVTNVTSSGGGGGGLMTRKDQSPQMQHTPIQQQQQYMQMMTHSPNTVGTHGSRPTTPQQFQQQQQQQQQYYAMQQQQQQQQQHSGGMMIMTGGARGMIAVPDHSPMTYASPSAGMSPPVDLNGMNLDNTNNTNNTNSNNTNDRGRGYHIVDDSKMDMLPDAPMGGHLDANQAGMHVKAQQSMNTPDLPEFKQINPNDGNNRNQMDEVYENGGDRNDNDESEDNETESENDSDIAEKY